MLIDRVPSLAEHVLAFAHIPKTAGTSLRLFLGGWFRPEECLEYYSGDLEKILAARSAPVRFAMGHHIRWGIQRHFREQLLFVTVVRHPVDRYLSLYQAISDNPRNSLHPHSVGRDINAFLDFLLESDIPAARAQLGNLQCRMVSDAAEGTRAAENVREHFWLACAIEQVDRFAEVLADACGKPRAVPPKLNVRQSARAAASLSETALRRLLASDAGDLELYHSVHAGFEDLSVRY